MAWKAHKRALQSSLIDLPVCILIMPTICKHPKVRIVSRQDDIEFVECLDCSEVFDSDEFRDMEIEEKAGLTASEDEEPG